MFHSIIDSICEDQDRKKKKFADFDIPVSSS